MACEWGWQQLRPECAARESPLTGLGQNPKRARQCSDRFPPNSAILYGTRFSVPYRIPQSSQALQPWVLALLLSRPPKCCDFRSSSHPAASFPQMPLLPGSLFVCAWLRGVVGRRSGDVRNFQILRHCVHGKTPAKRSAQRIAATRTAAWLSMALCWPPTALRSLNMGGYRRLA
jgi:hypothetical protein